MQSLYITFTWNSVPAITTMALPENQPRRADVVKMLVHGRAHRRGTAQRPLQIPLSFTLGVDRSLVRRVEASLQPLPDRRCHHRDPRD